MSLNLKVDGLEEYYKPKPKVFHDHVEIHHIDKLGQLVENLKNYEWINALFKSNKNKSK